MSDSAIIPYGGASPGADSNTYVLFSSVTAFPGKRYPGMHGYKRFVVSVRHNNATATVMNLYKSTNRGVNWFLIGTFSAASTTVDDVFDCLVEHLDDFKVEWVNGGTAQTTFIVSMALTSERANSI